MTKNALIVPIIAIPAMVLLFAPTTNIATIAVAIAVASFFGLFSWASAYDHHSNGEPIPPSLWVAVSLGFVVCSYAHVVHHWPWLNLSLGVFITVNIWTSVLLRAMRRPPAVTRTA